MLNSPFVLPSGLKVRNRLVKAATTESLSDDYGRATPQLANLYYTWSKESDVGLIITGNVQVDRRFLERPGNVCVDLDYKDDIDTKEELALLKAIPEAARRGNPDTKILGQISHGGRQSNSLVCHTAKGPSAIPALLSGMPVAQKVVELTIEEIEHLIKKFSYAAKVLQEAGFDGIQLHSAHGYLLSSFLNPLANQRSDNYGGSVANRASFLIQVVQAVREATSRDFTVSVKLNSSDFQKGGFTIEECCEVSQMLSQVGLDLLEVSGGNYENPVVLTGNVPESTKRREAFFLNFAEKICRHLKETNSELPVMVTGGFRTRTGMDAALEGGEIALLGVARPLCVDPGCTKRVLSGEAQALPDVEKHWKLPFFLGMSYFNKFSLMKALSMGAAQNTMFENLVQMGDGTFTPQTEEKYPNILVGLWRQRKAQAQKAKNMKGLKKDPDYLHAHL